MTYKCFPPSFKLSKSIIQYLVDEFCLIFVFAIKQYNFLIDNVVS